MYLIIIIINNFMKQIIRVCCGYRDENNKIVQCDKILTEGEEDRELLEVEAVLGIVQLSHGACFECLSHWIKDFKK